MRVPFTKMHGLGNDFVIIDARSTPLDPTAARIRELAHRRKGIGFDQALVLVAPRRPDTYAYYRIFNADGHEVEQCGNGARCLASLLFEESADRDLLSIESAGGVVEARPAEDGLVAVSMGVPNFDPHSLPFDADAEAMVYPLELADGEVEIGVVSMGNPHAVLQVESAEGTAVERLGPAIENHPRFARGTNVGFMEIVDPGHLRLRVHERGVGETLACGTGACAAVAVARRWRSMQETVKVDLPGGRLMVSWAGPENVIWLKGPAEKVFEGHTEL